MKYHSITLALLYSSPGGVFRCSGNVDAAYEVPVDAVHVYPGRGRGRGLSGLAQRPHTPSHQP